MRTIGWGQGSRFAMSNRHGKNKKTKVIENKLAADHNKHREIPQKTKVNSYHELDAKVFTFLAKWTTKKSLYNQSAHFDIFWWSDLFFGWDKKIIGQFFFTKVFKIESHSTFHQTLLMWTLKTVWRKIKVALKQIWWKSVEFYFKYTNWQLN